jgi:23S rRNA pseudouridine1911/1915/1917 synthase
MEDIKVIFEDEDLVVIDKNAGIVVNRSDTSRHIRTVQDFAEEKIGIKKKEYLSEFESRGGVVHRLDKETSGLLIIAKNEASFNNIKEQFKGRNVKKVYLALCHGKIEPSVGNINVPVGRLPWNRTKFGVLPEGREAATSYKVLETKHIDYGKEHEELSLVELYPSTGRTHQIRVHMRHISHPIFSDLLYAGRKVSKRDRKLLSRHFLHASKISFTHPSNGKKMEFASPLPQELLSFLKDNVS